MSAGIELLAFTIGKLSKRIDDRDAEITRLRGALIHVRKIISEGAETGFNCRDGDWAERLFASQALTHAALTSHYRHTQEK